MSDDQMDDFLDPREQQQIISNVVKAIIDDHALIDQATGMLMLVHGVDADLALDILISQARRHSVDVLAMAERTLKDFVGLTSDAAAEFRLAFDDVWLTAHPRITSITPRHHAESRDVRTGVDDQALLEGEGYSAAMVQTPPYDDTSLPDYDSLAPTELCAGWFRFYFADELWEWSAEVARIHGYPDAEMRPTTEQVMSHKHPEDSVKMAATLDHVRRNRAAVSTRHRIIDVQGDTHEVVVVSQHLRDPDGEVIGVEGFYADVTPSGNALNQADRDREARVNQKVADVLARRTVIDEVKGMLMVIYRLDDQHAFDLLRWRSQLTNTKLRALAEQLRDEFAVLDYDEDLPPRSTFDQVLLTAHERVHQP